MGKILKISEIGGAGLRERAGRRNAQASIDSLNPNYALGEPKLWFSVSGDVK